jgi:hypothetical protein
MIHSAFPCPGLASKFSSSPSSLIMIGVEIKKERGREMKRKTRQDEPTYIYVPSTQVGTYTSYKYSKTMPLSLSLWLER